MEHENAYTRNFYGILIYVMVHSSVSLLVNLWETCILFNCTKKGLWILGTPSGCKNTVVHYRFYKINQLFLYALLLCMLSIRYLRLYDLIKVPFAFDDFCFVWFSLSLTWSILQFVQLLPVVGHFIVALQRMLANLFCFLLFFLLFTLSLSQLFLQIIEHNHIKCKSTFGGQWDRLYSTFLVLLNMFDFRKINVGDEVSTYMLHFIFVCIGTIVLLNFLIALFSSNVAWVDKHKEVIVTVQRIAVVNVLEIRLYYFFNKPYIYFLSRYFQKKNGRFYLTLY